MSTLQEVNWVINAKKQLCHQISPKSPFWRRSFTTKCTPICYTISWDWFMILMLRSFQFNALPRGSQRSNLPYKKALRDILRGGDSVYISCHRTLSLRWLLLGFSVLNIWHLCNNTSLSNKPKSYLLIFVCCCGRESQFLSVPMHSELTFPSTLPIFYVPNPLSPLGYNKTLDGE